MEKQSSTSKVTVEYFDPHDVYKLLTPGLIPRLPLRNLHWQSHAGPLRSIDTLHVELVQGGDDDTPTATATPTPSLRPSNSTSRDDGFQTQQVGGQAAAAEAVDPQSAPTKSTASQRRHQIPGLRRTPYLKVLLVRCDDNDSYKNTIRSEIREWIKTHTPPSTASKKGSKEEMHDAFEWLIVHVVIPNTAAATQPRSTGKTDGSTPDKATTSRWRTGSTPLLEKLRSDFNSASKGSPDRIAQIRIGINDVPYDVLPRVVPAVPSGYSETVQDAEAAWSELIGKFTSQILTSFDRRVTQYEEDIKEKDAQRLLPGWNFCTFFILKEGLARGFENVGLVEDALVGYDELSVGLDSVIHEQAETASPERHGGAMLNYTEGLKETAKRALAKASGEDQDEADEEAEDLQAKEAPTDKFDNIPISAAKKAYRDMILENKVSVFDFRCYIFSRQISLLLRQGNAAYTREELLSKLKLEEESTLRGVAPLTPLKQGDETEDLSVLAEICRRTLQFIPSISQVMRQDIISSILKETLTDDKSSGNTRPDLLLEETADNLVATFAFSVAQQILAQTSTRALPIPPSLLTLGDGPEPKASIPEPKTMMHPARSSSLHEQRSPGPQSPELFPGPLRRASVAASNEVQNNQFLKPGIEQLAAKRAELYMLSRSILDGLGKKRNWSTGWDKAPLVEQASDDFEEVSLDGDTSSRPNDKEASIPHVVPLMAGIDNHILQTATDNADDFYRLYEILTDRALCHYSVANHEHAVRATTADLAVLKYHLKEYRKAAACFLRTTPLFGEEGWSSLELSMLVMYAHCLDELQSKEEYVSVALTLLKKACAAERNRLLARPMSLLIAPPPAILEASPIMGVIERLLSQTAALSNEIKVPLVNFFSNIEVAGSPEYYDRQDKCSLSISLRSLLPEDLSLDGIELRLTCADDGPCRELVFESKGSFALSPGKNTLQVACSSVVSGAFKVSSLHLLTHNIRLHFERDANAAAATADIFKKPDVHLFQRSGCLDVQIQASKLTALDKDNSLDLELTTGWNDVKSCEIRVKPATGGLRLVTVEAQMVDSSIEFAKRPEAGAFFFGPLGADTSVVLRFPFSTESDVGDVLAKVDVTYVTTSGGSFHLAKSVSVPVSLALGVSVQDVFKHQALFSRFNVSTATSSPLRLYRSELLESNQFESSFGVPPRNTVLVFPKQPAGLLYKVKRKQNIKPTKRPGRTLHLKLYYSLLQTEIEEMVKESVSDALNGTPLEQYSKVILACVDEEVKINLNPYDLERAGLVGALATSFLQEVSWAQNFQGFGNLPGTTDDVASRISTVLSDWQRAHPVLQFPEAPAGEPRALVIPVEIPSISIVHTADIRFDRPLPGPVQDKSGGTPTVSTNQMLPATLHLKWTRVWDTDTAQGADQEFSYEVTAPADTWLLGGRRSGHFIIPGGQGSVHSTPETEAEIPLILIPLREGWLPYPTVEIKAIRADDGTAEAGTPTCEIDWRNLGETVRVVSEQRGVTLSLDASGPGGGPLVLGSEALERHGGRIVA